MRNRQSGKGNFAASASKVHWTVPGAKEAVDEQRNRARLKPDINWSSPEGGSSRRQHFPASYREPPNVDPTIAEQFVVGRPVMAARDLTMSRDQGTYQFAPLETFVGESDQAHIPKGSLLIYTGAVRQEERIYVNSKARDVSVLKHTFITPMGRCIIHDFNLIQLITDEDLE